MVLRSPETTSHGTHARHKLSEIEWFDEVVICAGIQAAYSILNVATSSHHDDGRVVCATQLSANLQTIHARQDRLKDHKIRLMAVKCLEGPTTVAAAHDIEALVHQPQ